MNVTGKWLESLFVTRAQLTSDDLRLPQAIKLLSEALWKEVHDESGYTVDLQRAAALIIVEIQERNYELTDDLNNRLNAATERAATNSRIAAALMWAVAAYIAEGDTDARALALHAAETQLRVRLT